MTEASRFLVRRRADRVSDEASSEVLGPWSIETVRAAFATGDVARDDSATIYGSSIWLPLPAWEALELDVSPPPRHLPERHDMPQQLAVLSSPEGRDICDQVRWWFRDGQRTRGPLNSRQLREQLRDHGSPSAMVALVGGHCWCSRSAFEPIFQAPWRAEAHSTGALLTCGVCLEEVPLDSSHCSECGEALAPRSRYPVSSRPPSIPDDPPGTSWLRMHWRPVVTMTAMFALITSGIALRHLAPNRYQPPEVTMNPAAATEAACDTPCWHGEACQLGKCVWQAPNDGGHIDGKPTIAGPFELPPDMVDVLPLDADRYAVSYLRGVQVSNSRTGGTLSLVSDAPHAQKLQRVGDVIYATAPKRIYVIEASTTRLLKTIEMGSAVHSLTMGANGSRVIASIPGAHAVAIISTDYHAEVARFFFGDDQVRAVAIDDTGKRALTMNGMVPPRGVRPPTESVRYGAMYAFDPSRLPSEQDRVRTGVEGNPVDVIMTPDAHTSYAVLREKDVIVRLEHLPSGAVRQQGRLNTCREPEAIELVHRGRRAIATCNTGAAVEIFDLQRNELVRTVPVNSRVSDIAVTPDGRQAILALPRDRSGAIGMLDLDSYELTLHQVNAEPHRVRIAPDGGSAVVISDRSKVAWVIR